MKIENEFTVAAPLENLWAHLLDVERIAPCMPGAELTETVDDRTWKGRVNIKLGPVSLSFAGTVAMEERDDEAHRVVLRAKGMEQKGKGAANASVTGWLEPAEGQTSVKMIADIQLTGAVAQLSRGLLPEVSRKLTAQFADCLQAGMEQAEAATRAGAGSPASLAATGEEASSDSDAATGGEMASDSVAQAEPISGIRVGLAAVWAAAVNLVRRLFGRRS